MTKVNAFWDRTNPNYAYSVEIRSICFDYLSYKFWSHTKQIKVLGCSFRNLNGVI